MPGRSFFRNVDSLDLQARPHSKLDSELRKCTAQLSAMDAFVTRVKQQASDASKEATVCRTSSEEFFKEAEGASQKADAIDERANLLEKVRTNAINLEHFHESKVHEGCKYPAPFCSSGPTHLVLCVLWGNVGWPWRGVAFLL